MFKVTNIIFMVGLFFILGFQGCASDIEDELSAQSSGKGENGEVQIDALNLNQINKDLIEEEGLRIKMEGDLIHYAIPYYKLNDASKEELVRTIAQQTSEEITAKLDQMKESIKTGNLPVDIATSILIDGARGYKLNEEAITNSIKDGITNGYNQIKGIETTVNNQLEAWGYSGTENEMLAWLRNYNPAHPSGILVWGGVGGTATLGIGINGSLTFILAAHFWYEFTVDTKTGEVEQVKWNGLPSPKPTVLVMSTEDVAAGGGGGGGFRGGAGLILGPVDSVDNLQGALSGNLSCSGNVPVIGGGAVAKFVFPQIGENVLKKGAKINEWKQPLMVMLGYSQDVFVPAGKIECHAGWVQMYGVEKVKEIFGTLFTAGSSSK